MPFGGGGQVAGDGVVGGGFVGGGGWCPSPLLGKNIYIKKGNEEKFMF